MKRTFLILAILFASSSWAAILSKVDNRTSIAKFSESVKLKITKVNTPELIFHISNTGEDSRKISPDKMKALIKNHYSEVIKAHGKSVKINDLEFFLFQDQNDSFLFFGPKKDIQAYSKKF
jgi:hypothetical protein